MGIIHQAFIIKRIRALFESMMSETDAIPVTLRPVVRNLVDGYLKKADPSQVRAIIERVRDEIIPWLLKDEDIAQ